MIDNHPMLIFYRPVTPSGGSRNFGEDGCVAMEVID